MLRSFNNPLGTPGPISEIKAKAKAKIKAAPNSKLAVRLATGRSRESQAGPAAPKSVAGKKA